MSPSRSMRTAIVVAAGEGRRMRAAGSADKLPKQFLDLAGKPVVV
ncbi:MAG: hypothetical protein ACE5E0_02415 [Terriglobia bacterium]